jgi:hypothetical protein
MAWGQRAQLIAATCAGASWACVALSHGPIRSASQELAPGAVVAPGGVTIRRSRLPVVLGWLVERGAGGGGQMAAEGAQLAGAELDEAAHLGIEALESGRVVASTLGWFAALDNALQRDGSDVPEVQDFHEQYLLTRRSEGTAAGS